MTSKEVEIGTEETADDCLNNNKEEVLCAEEIRDGFVDIKEEEDVEAKKSATEQECSSNNDGLEQTSPRSVLEVVAESESSSKNLPAFDSSAPTDSDASSNIGDDSSIDSLTAPTDSDVSSNSSDSSSVDNSTAPVDSDGNCSSSDSGSVGHLSSCSLVVQTHRWHWKRMISGLIMGKKRSVSRQSTFPNVTRSASLRAALQRITSSKVQSESKDIFVEVSVAKPSWRNFDYSELSAATDDFSPEKLIGKGGHAEVYKGYLADGQLVAVKRLLNKRENEAERTADFLSELGIIAHVNHPNAAQLLGFSVERGLHLILKFSPHGSLASVLHGTEKGLDWKARFRIAIGVAEGLLYLHEGCQRRIIHRDIKASNILLTEDFQPQISDFGLAKWLPNKWSHHIVFPIEGTFGYMAPEYFMHGVVNEKTDVFAYGVLLLELITGRKAVDSSRQSLVIWAKPLLVNNNMKELIDSSLGDAYDSKEVSCALQVASICIHHISTSRPSMNEVIRLLTGEEGLKDTMHKDSRYKVARLPLFDACEMDDYTCSRYLNDLSKHKQLALEQ